MLSDCCLHQVVQFKLLRLILVNPATNVIFEKFPWLILNRSRNTYPTLQRMRVVVCSTAFFHEQKFILKNLAKMSFQETFDINHYYYHYCYCTLIHC